MELRRCKITNKIIVRNIYGTFSMMRDNEKLLNEVYASDFGKTYLPEDGEEFSSIDGLKNLRKYYIPMADEIEVRYTDKYSNTEHSILKGNKYFEVDIINEDSIIFKGWGMFCNEIKIERNSATTNTWMPNTGRVYDVMDNNDSRVSDISKRMISYIKFKNENIYKPRFCVTYYEYLEDICFELTFYKNIRVDDYKAYYHKYLKSKRWNRTRDEVLESRGRKCQLCGDSNDNIHVHHNTYDRVGFEKDEDLIILCNKCHAKFHDKINNIA